MAAATVLPASAARRSDDPAGLTVGVPTQIATTADTSQCLTYVAAEDVPMAVMLPRNPAPTSQVQYWTLTDNGALRVSLSKSVGGELASTGACLDTGSDRATVPADAPGPGAGLQRFGRPALDVRRQDRCAGQRGERPGP